MSRPLHKKVHAVCPVGADSWSACDRVTDAVHADWEAMQTVLLAWRLAQRDLKPWRKDKAVFPQLVLYIAGESSAIFNKDGNPSQSPEVRRIMSAIDRVVAGNLPGYNLYKLQEGT